jgi:trehalose/maltose hydrolase-like predicted phosphorylase
MAAELADPANPADPYLHIASDFYRDSATIDLDNHRDETHRGIHAANMGGSWMGIIFGFAGMRTHNNRLSFKPVMPTGWKGYSFCVYYQGRRIQGNVSANSPLKVTFKLLEGDPMDIDLYGKIVHVGN